MSTDITVPVFPESVTEGTILSWHKQPGELVARGELLAEVETDKVVFEVPAPVDGILAEITTPAGSTVKSGEVVGRLDKSAKITPKTSPVATETVPKAVVVMPAAKRLMEEHALDARKVSGSGKGGRVLKEDVQKQLDINESVPAPVAHKPKPSPAAPVRTLAAAPAEAGERPEKRVPMTRLRARIAERLVEAQRTAAILTTFNEVNMQPVMELRTRHRERFEQEHGVRLGFMSFFVKAAIEALRHFPEVNASIDDHDIVYHGFYDIGIAVGTPRGLVVPVLRDADQLTMAEIESRIRDFGERAQNGRLTLEEITGGTFTITNGGVFGSLLSTPILNPPQAAILGMHKIQERPVAEKGQVVIRPIMYLALSYDHRLIDGREAVQFLVMIKELLEDPARLLLEV
ncbi:2-oxoglutarate dehydrogenase complex dihydrolipoyllysine-residue succinyltransferase, partial [Sulfuricaulis sp.]|jgi:2-oxoglutarate dehydrogenase E2 component (dihydrolipoamide succinyltransferase)|uniref:2-oxoglutarate dehydrogenase complex dihydrolipoyllysine-residue succinyltransferase n=1 Tax=Sulfuricaulis sp. TaxID=2003553 RepID=UPI00355A330F